MKMSRHLYCHFKIGLTLLKRFGSNSASMCTVCDLCVSHGSVTVVRGRVNGGIWFLIDKSNFLERVVCLLELEG